jgi:hypothetical protein
VIRWHIIQSNKPEKISIDNLVEQARLKKDLDLQDIPNEELEDWEEKNKFLDIDIEEESWTELWLRLRSYSDLELALNFVVYVLEFKQVCGTENACPIHQKIFGNIGDRNENKISLYSKLDDLRRGLGYLNSGKYRQLSEITISAASKLINQEKLPDWVEKYEELKQLILSIFGEAMRWSQLHEAQLEAKADAHVKYLEVIDKIKEYEQQPPQDSNVGVDQYMQDLRQDAGILPKAAQNFSRQMDRGKIPQSYGKINPQDQIPANYDPVKMHKKAKKDFQNLQKPK